MNGKKQLRDRATKDRVFHQVWKNRKWEFIQCDIGGEELVSQKSLPGGTSAYLVYVFKDVGGSRSNHFASELVLVPGEEK